MEIDHILESSEGVTHVDILGKKKLKKTSTNTTSEKNNKVTNIQLLTLNIRSGNKIIDWKNSHS